MRPTIGRFGMLASLMFGLTAMAVGADTPHPTSPYGQIIYPAPAKKPVAEILEPIFEDTPPANDRSANAKPAEKPVQTVKSRYRELPCDSCGATKDHFRKVHALGLLHRGSKDGCDPCR